MCIAPQVLKVCQLHINFGGLKGWHGSDPTKLRLYFKHWFLTQWTRRAKQSGWKAPGFVSAEDCGAFGEFLQLPWVFLDGGQVAIQRGLDGWNADRWRGITKVSVVYTVAWIIKSILLLNSNPLREGGGGGGEDVGGGCLPLHFHQEFFFLKKSVRICFQWKPSPLK